ncbi:MAG: hypothetical protein H6707_06350 [Deltaproteobacteria bacterium]|nr:hypothetical protein [Deltaproteobacteria bacterium]
MKTDKDAIETVLALRAAQRRRAQQTLADAAARLAHLEQSRERALAELRELQGRLDAQRAVAQVPQRVLEHRRKARYSDALKEQISRAKVVWEQSESALSLAEQVLDDSRRALVVAEAELDTARRYQDRVQASERARRAEKSDEEIAELYGRRRRDQDE